METSRYANGSIYKVVDLGYNKQYFGSTSEKLSQRMVRHRASYKSYKNNPEKSHRNSVYDIFDEYGMENCKIELVEYYPCNTKEELQRREGQIIKENDCINKRVEGRTKQEYKEDNKEHIQEYMKQYNITHKEEISENKQKYRESKKDFLQEVIECKCGAFITREWKGRHESSELHRRYLEFKENPNDKLVKCSCGSIIPKHKLNRHKQSLKHFKYNQEI